MRMSLLCTSAGSHLLSYFTDVFHSRGQTAYLEQHSEAAMTDGMGRPKMSDAFDHNQVINTSIQHMPCEQALPYCQNMKSDSTEHSHSCKPTHHKSGEDKVKLIQPPARPRGHVTKHRCCHSNDLQQPKSSPIHRPSVMFGQYPQYRYAAQHQQPKR